VINSGRAVFARAVGCMEMATFSASMRRLGRLSRSARLFRFRKQPLHGSIRYQTNAAT
jgi:hypothetical protein